MDLSAQCLSAKPLHRITREPTGCTARVKRCATGQLPAARNVAARVFEQEQNTLVAGTVRRTDQAKETGVRDSCDVYCKKTGLGVHAEVLQATIMEWELCALFVTTFNVRSLILMKNHCF